MVLMGWLLLGYLMQTTGELCLSPVGLSMVTKLSPSHLVSTVMGMWFLATAFSQFLAAIIAQFTGVTHGSGESVIPAPDRDRRCLRRRVRQDRPLCHRFGYFLSDSVSFASVLDARGGGHASGGRATGGRLGLARLGTR